MSARPGHEISEDDRRYQNGTMPALLEVIDVPMQVPQPHGYQSENHLIDDKFYWTLRSAVTWASLQAAVEEPAGPLWLNGDSTTYGENDRVAEHDVASLTRSLYLVRPTELAIIVAVEGGGMYPSKRRVRARFKLNGYRYCLSVTDPKIESVALGGEDGETSIPEALICVSLGEVWNGAAYKLVAAIITP